MNDVTLKQIYEKLCTLEEKIRHMEIIATLESYASPLKIIEEHAKICPNFNGYTLKKEIMKYQVFEGEHEQQITAECSCKNQQHTLIITGLDIKEPFFKLCVEEINQKYKNPPTPKPEISNSLYLLEP